MSLHIVQSGGDNFGIKKKIRGADGAKMRLFIFLSFIFTHGKAKKIKYKNINPRKYVMKSIYFGWAFFWKTWAKSAFVKECFQCFKLYVEKTKGVILDSRITFLIILQYIKPLTPCFMFCYFSFSCFSMSNIWFVFFLLFMKYKFSVTCLGFSKL